MKLRTNWASQLEGSRMNLEELLRNMSATEAQQPAGVEVGNGSTFSSLQLQGNLGIGRTMSDKTVDEVWREIQLGEKKIGEVVKTERKPTVGEMTLEDFLAKTETEAYGQPSLSPVMGLDAVDVIASQRFSQQMGLSPAPSLGTQSDTPISGRKRDAQDAKERSMERKMRRKIKNRESAARSRARKQAYHNELVSRVSQLEVMNMRLKKEKELDEMLDDQSPEQPRYQLRRTSSAVF